MHTASERSLEGFQKDVPQQEVKSSVSQCLRKTTNRNQTISDLIGPHPTRVRFVPSVQQEYQDKLSHIGQPMSYLNNIPPHCADPHHQLARSVPSSFHPFPLQRWTLRTRSTAKVAVWLLGHSCCVFCVFEQLIWELLSMYCQRHLMR